MPRWMKVAAGCVLALVLVVAGSRLLTKRGPTGATVDYGGALPAKSIPEFSSLDAGRWVNGAPTSLASVRGQVVVLEGWHPA
jgi:hypothetical protein